MMKLFFFFFFFSGKRFNYTGAFRGGKKSVRYFLFPAHLATHSFQNIQNDDTTIGSYFS